MRAIPSLVATFLLASGCVGTVDDLPPPDPGADGGTVVTKQGKTMYVNDVHPIIAAKCSGGGCHTQAGVTGMYGFAVATAEDAYQQVTGLPTLVGAYTPVTAGMLTKIEGSHNNVVYAADDTTKITAWLAQELADRDDGTQPPPLDPIAKLRAWTGCMSLDNFEAANMPIAWGNLTATTLQRCANCHGAGLDSFMTGTGNNATVYFDAITKEKDLLLKYFTVDPMGAIIINTGSMNSAGVTLPGHPRFNPTTNAGMVALTEFYDLTVVRQTAGLCDPPRLP